MESEKKIWAKAFNVEIRSADDVRAAQQRLMRELQPMGLTLVGDPVIFGMAEPQVGEVSYRNPFPALHAHLRWEVAESLSNGS